MTKVVRTLRMVRDSNAARPFHWVYWRLNTFKRRLPWWAFSRWALTVARIWTPPTFRKYGRPEPDDVVLDVGAMIGEFTLPASLYAEKVYALEPDRRSFYELYRSSPTNVEVMPFAATDETRLSGFNLSSSPSSSSLDTVDIDAPSRLVKSIYVRATRLDELDFIDDVTFLKIDAEGVEPEVLRGLGDVRPDRISVDVGPERFGESTKEAVEEILTDYGYDVRLRKENVLEARCGESDISRDELVRRVRG